MQEQTSDVGAISAASMQSKERRPRHTKPTEALGYPSPPQPQRTMEVGDFYGGCIVSAVLPKEFGSSMLSSGAMLLSEFYSSSLHLASQLSPKTKNEDTRAQEGSSPDCAPEKVTEKAPEKVDAAGTTEKYGLEAGLYKVMTDKPVDGEEPTKSRTDQAKDLLKKYGSAYLLTSISFAIVSFSLCYFAVDNGVDMGALLAKFGLTPSSKSETVGTFAIAYAAHKALSPEFVGGRTWEHLVGVW
eukprot:gene16353-22553_t